LRRRGKNADARLETDYLDWALADFSGYLVLDEMYDGPFCVLSAVDGPNQRRLLYEVLEHDPTHKDIRRFLRRLEAAVLARAGQVLGVTTDGSALYPEPLAELFPGVPHQVCEFHILKELVKVVLRVVARLRKRLAEGAPKLPRGRPPSDPETQRKVRRAKRIEARVSELFEHRHLFVRHHLSAARRRQVRQLSRGQRQLRAVRQIMDEVYRLFDRRCRTDTALVKLGQLRQKVKRYRSLGRSLDKLKSPNLEKALTFLDERLLGATSNAVERSNRRVRKMQKTVYRVRTKESLCGRLALDLQRDEQSAGRQATTGSLHEGRERLQ
jgi:Transposase